MKRSVRCCATASHGLKIMHVDFGGEHANGMRQIFGEESGERALHAAVTNLLPGLLPAFVFLKSTLLHDVCAGCEVRSGGCAKEGVGGPMKQANKMKRSLLLVSDDRQMYQKTGERAPAARDELLISFELLELIPCHQPFCLEAR